MEYDAEYTCRTCLKTIDTGTSIYDMPNNIEIKFIDILITCVNADMNLDNSEYYPNKLCPTCIDAVSSAWRFVEMCKTSEKVLQKHFSNSVKYDIEERFPVCDIAIKEEIKQEDDIMSDGGVSVKSEMMCGSIKIEKISNKLKTKRCKKTLVRLRNIDKKKNADVKSICPVCEIKFDSELKLRKHIKSIHPDCNAEIVYDCKICRKQFKRKTDLVVHRRIHSGERPFKCPICSRGFSQSGTLIEHSRVHTGETPFRCQICKKVFSSRSSFWRHRLVHSKEKLFACEVCGKTFAHGETLKHHKKVHSEDRPYVCNVCNKAMKSKYALQQHIHIHSGRNFICEHCGKKFSMKHNVELHIKKMHSENAGECRICSKVTSNLSEHMLIHSDHKPYKCKICDREFRQKNSLSFHLTMHKNAEKYQCKVEGCKKAFPKQNMLTFHINKIHSNQTPHVCTKCPKGFYRNSDLSRHINIAHLP